MALARRGAAPGGNQPGTTKGDAVKAEDMILVSVDDHIVEPPDMFDNHLTGKYADRKPYIHRTSRGTDVWIYEGQRIANLAINAVAGRPKEEYGVDPTSFEQIRPGQPDPGGRHPRNGLGAGIRHQPGAAEAARQLPVGQRVQLGLDDLERQVLVALCGQDEPQARAVVGGVFPIPRRRSLRRDEAPVLQKPDLGDGDVREIGLQQAQDRSDRHPGELGSIGGRH